jgi:hypothetical protein
MIAGGAGAALQYEVVVWEIPGMKVIVRTM